MFLTYVVKIGIFMLKVLITVLNEVPDYTTTFGYGKKVCINADALH